MYFKQHGEASMTGAGGLKRVSPELLRQHHTPFPPIEIQRIIADHLDREIDHNDAVEREIEHSMTLMRERRAALISAAVTGQIPLEEMAG